MNSAQQDQVSTAGPGEDALTSPLHLPHAAAECPKCFTELQQNRDWWSARPDGSRLVGLVVAREGMPSVVQQREDLTRFGVPIEGFRHPAPDILESWGDRIARLIDTLGPGDVLVVANIHALGRDIDEESRTVAELRRRGVMVKVLSHHARHLADAGR
ncbi:MULTISPECIES: recombinase family protein [unclassified Microbacterium]|uniref:recombinase family protein n=1 Tax=unclassified Microbacterium TaxID=2609290 RepID=UPI003010090D